MKKTEKSSNSTDNGGLRLHVYLARSGVASRRAGEALVAAGRVRVNGTVISKPGSKVRDTDVVTVDGKRVAGPQRPVYLLLNKPERYLCSNADPEGRPLAVHLVRSAISGRIYTVGRLDFLSSGLILLTNDGEFCQAVSHPSRRIEKEYIVETKRDIPEEFLKEYKKGIVVEGERYRLKDYRVDGPRTVRVVLTEGKNRELRVVFGSRMLHPKRIHRIRIGGVVLKGLALGEFRHLRRDEVEGLKGGIQ